MTPRVAGYIRRATVYRQSAGAVAIEGAIQSNFTVETNNQWDATLTLSGNNVLVQVKGIVGATINWKSIYKFLDVS